jgi:hypothetical protein
VTDNPQLESWKLNHQASVTSGAAAIRTVLLINGGAAGAILAFIGGMASQGRISVVDINNIANGLTSFGFGVFTAALAMALGYLANRTILATVVCPTKARNLASWVAQVAAVAAFVFSLALFVIGLCQVRAAIGEMKFLPPQTTTRERTTSSINFDMGGVAEGNAPNKQAQAAG